MLVWMYVLAAMILGLCRMFLHLSHRQRYLIDTLNILLAGLMGCSKSHGTRDCQGSLLISACLTDTIPVFSTRADLVSLFCCAFLTSLLSYAHGCQCCMIRAML
jgi:hypothetical protein